MPTAVITGCNSGIGYHLAKIALKQGYKTFATSRSNGDKLKELQEAGAQTSTLDIGSSDAITAFKKEIGDEQVDLLIHNAASFIGFHDTLKTTTAQQMEEAFRINATGPLLLTQVLLPNLLASVKASGHAGDTPTQGGTQVSHIATRGASMGDGPSGGGYTYRVSKAAMNMVGVNLAADLKKENIAVSMVHPGMVRTGFLESGQIPESIRSSPLMVDADFAAQKCWAVIMKVDVKTTGKFFHRDGFELPW